MRTQPAHAQPTPYTLQGGKGGASGKATSNKQSRKKAPSGEDCGAHQIFGQNLLSAASKPPRGSPGGKAKHSGGAGSLLAAVAGTSAAAWSPFGHQPAAHHQTSVPPSAALLFNSVNSAAPAIMEGAGGTSASGGSTLAPIPHTTPSELSAAIEQSHHHVPIVAEIVPRKYTNKADPVLKVRIEWIAAYDREHVQVGSKPLDLFTTLKRSSNNGFFRKLKNIHCIVDPPHILDDEGIDIGSSLEIVDGGECLLRDPMH